MTSYFYDSYAIIEYLKNNKSFTPYFEQHIGIITIFNLVEVYYSTLAESGEKNAEIVFNSLLPLVVEPSKDAIKKAMKFRLQHKKRRLSYADCIGYTVAEEHSVMFLTGDEQFRNMEGVRFLK